MLAASRYPSTYVETTRAGIDARVAAYRGLGDVPPGFASAYFTDLVLVLELAFVHRVRNAEGKDGNPLNEVRLIAASVLTNGGRMLADKQIRLRPESSVLGLAPGDEIVLTEESFTRLADAFLTEISKRYSDDAM